MKKIIFGAIVLTALVFTSCDDDNPIEPSVVAPATYAFERNGNNNVSFGGQTTRIAMAEELTSSLKDNSKTEAELDNMFAHTAGSNDFSNSDLNASGKNIRSKTAASKDYFSGNATDAASIKAQFDGWISSQTSEVFPNWGVIATAGNAGGLQEAGGGSTRYVSGKGLEYNQAFAKSLTGALMTDQILNNYLSTAVLDDATNRADNDNEVLVAGKDYTLMEHKWDEAYGYLYGAEANPAVPVLGADSFLNKYLGKVDSDEDFAGIADDIYNAFKLGRAAIVAKNYAVRDDQAEIIRTKISKVIAVRAVHYLQAGKDALAADKASAFHDLSEGYGFLFSLQFTRVAGTNSPHFSKAEVDAFLSTLMEGNGFWDVTPATLDSMSTEIANEFGFTVDQA